MGVLDYIFGTYPSKWTAQQTSAFSRAYDSMVAGTFSWTDFIPPTDLPGVGSTMMMWSLKGLVQFGNKGTTALDVEFVHNKLLAGAKPSDIYEDYQYTKLKRPGTGMNEKQVLCVILKLESIVYGSASGWNRRGR
jgi:hypothetical protein